MSHPSTLAPGIGARISAARVGADESREALAVAVGRSAQTVMLWELGKVVPSVDTLAAVARHYGLALADLIGDE